MSGQIIFRPYEKEDEQAIKDIIRVTWNYDRFSGPKIAAKLAKIFLYSCLANQTYTQVAVTDGKPVGIIMGKNAEIHKCPIHYRIGQILAITSLLASSEGRRVSRIFQNVSKIDEELLENCGKQYRGEVAFFAIDPMYRGLGIGKKLFEKVCYYMEHEEIGNFYLFTDTSCNYGFYEHQGMKRKCEKKASFTINGESEDMGFFLYDYQGA